MVANLKKLRLEKGYSQQKLAGLLGITQQAVYKYENLSVEPDIATLIRMADIFGVSVDYLIGRTTDTPAQVLVTTDEIAHLASWRELPMPLRDEIDGILRKYRVVPVNHVSGTQ